MEDDYKSTILYLRTAGPSITVYLLTGRKKSSVTANTIAEEPIYQRQSSIQLEANRPEPPASKETNCIANCPRNRTGGGTRDNSLLNKLSTKKTR
jgi:hypothetical protein